jgi:glycosyltransferase involved in cell wall biosynthesis
MQFHILSFEGPDDYARVGGLETRVSGLLQALIALGHEGHLWFVGDPALPGHETRDGINLHRWCQWLSRYKRNGVYDGENEKTTDYATSLPPYIYHEYLLPKLLKGERAVVIAEEWHTANAVIHLDWRLRNAGLSPLVNIIWNANNTFGFDRIDWDQLGKAATITTVSRYMKLKMQSYGIDPIVIPNGLSPDAYDPPDRAAIGRFRKALVGRTVITKMARWDPDKRWLASIEIVRKLKNKGYRPLFIARGGSEPYGKEVVKSMKRAGLVVEDRINGEGSFDGLLSTIDNTRSIDVINLRSHVNPDSRRALFRASDIVLANSSHEPFGLVGLEVMAVGGIVCTGCSGEDYAASGLNTLVLQTGEPEEFFTLYRQLISNPKQISAMRRFGRNTAKHYAWSEVLRRDFLPRLDLAPTMCTELEKHDRVPLASIA